MKTSVSFYFGFIALVQVFIVKLADSQQVSACNPTPCQNGGSCFELPSGFVCQCSPGFIGDTCGTAGDGVVCEFNTCANGGTCVITDGVIECKCTSEYTGPTCEMRVNISITTTTRPTLVKTIPQTTPGSGSTETTRTTTVKTIPQTTQGSGSSEVDLWIIIAIAVPAVFVVILVVVLICCVMLKGKRRRKSNRSSNRNPRMIAEFKRNVQESDSANPGYESPSHSNILYDATKLDAYDDPPPDYDDHSINGFRIPEPRIYDNKQTANDYFTKSDLTTP